MSPRAFTGLFIFFVLLERITDCFAALKYGHLLAKPLLVISLLWYFFNRSKHLDKNTKKLTILALIFSVTGDILLMFQEHSPQFFIAGLAAFLIAHIFYSLLFNTKRNPRKNPLGFILILLGYAGILFYLCKDNLNNMLIPVLLYITVILIMATTAFLRQNTVSSTSYYWVLSGAIIFMLSDSTIAINKFYHPFSSSGTIIMITYALAQYLIVFGILKQETS